MLVLCSLLAGCGATGQGAGSLTGAESLNPAPKKALTLAVQAEPKTLVAGILGGGGSGESNVDYLIKDDLVVELDYEAYSPQLAVALPSIEAGSWRMHPDGTMETVWSLRPNARWHDGTLFTSADLVFSYQVYTDPAMPTRGEARSLMESVSAPDPQTLSIRWKAPFVNAYKEPPGDDILPRHLLEELYRGSDDKAAFIASPYFRSQFVGLGPYRLSRWEEGSHLDLVRFDDYYRGRPAIDTITVRFIPDANTMVANILAGTLDVVLPPAVGLDVALEVQRRWEGTGNQVVAGTSGALSALDPQVRPEYAQPRNGFPNSLVRQAFYHAIDRPTLTEVLTQGLAQVADSYFPPGHPLRRDVESSIPQFPYDLARAQQLLAQAGWTRGVEGVLVHQASGERFQTELRTDQEAGKERMVNVVANGWKAIGAGTSLNVVPAAIAGDREIRAKRTGFNVISASGSAYYDRNRLHSSQIAAEANRWTGINAGGYSNPTVDALLDQLRATIDPRQRVPIHQQLLREQIGDLGIMPLYWDVNTVLMARGVRGPKIVKGEATQNIFEWDREL